MITLEHWDFSGPKMFFFGWILLDCKKIVRPPWGTEWSVSKSLEKCGKDPLEIVKAQRLGALLLYCRRVKVREIK